MTPQANAEQAVRSMLREFAASHQLPPNGSVYAEDQMDDGSPICLRVTIDRATGDAVFDFEGTGASGEPPNRYLISIVNL